MNLQQKRPPITDYLALVNDRLHKLANTDRDIIEIIKVGDPFFFLVRIITKQIQSFETLFRYIEDRYPVTELMPLDQNDVKNRCLKEWNIPDDTPFKKRKPRRGNSNSFSQRPHQQNSFHQRSQPNQHKHPNSHSSNQDTNHANEPPNLANQKLEYIPNPHQATQHLQMVAKRPQTEISSGKDESNEAQSRRKKIKTSQEDEFQLNEVSLAAVAKAKVEKK